MPTLSHAVNEALHPFIVRAERVLAQHRALRLVVEFQVYPVDGEVAPTLLGLADEVSTQACARRLRRDALGREDVEITGDASDRAVALEEIEDAAVPTDVVIRKVCLLYTSPSPRDS